MESAQQFLALHDQSRSRPDQAHRCFGGESDQDIELCRHRIAATKNPSRSPSIERSKVAEGMSIAMTQGIKAHTPGHIDQPRHADAVARSARTNCCRSSPARPTARPGEQGRGRDGDDARQRNRSGDRSVHHPDAGRVRAVRAPQCRPADPAHRRGAAGAGQWRQGGGDPLHGPRRRGRDARAAANTFRDNLVRVEQNGSEQRDGGSAAPASERAASAEREAAEKKATRSALPSSANRPCIGLAQEFANRGRQHHRNRDRDID